MAEAFTMRVPDSLRESLREKLDAGIETIILCISGKNMPEGAVSCGEGLYLIELNVAELWAAAFGDEAEVPGG